MPHCQHAPGHLIVEQGAVSQPPVVGTQRCPIGHCKDRQGLGRQAPVAGLQKLPWLQWTLAQGSVWQAPATQLWLLPHLPGSQRSMQLPFAQYWLVPQVIPRHLSVWQMPATQILPVAQPSWLQSTQRPCTQVWGRVQETPAQSSTQAPLVSSQCCPERQVTVAQRWGMQ